jgi:hypothetical protein
MALIDAIADWFKDHSGLAYALTAISIAVFVVGLIAVRLLVVAMPADYFMRRHKPLESLDGRRPALRWTLVVLKNLLGLVLAVAGAMMMVAPGPGTLAILAGVSLMDFPGKRSLELAIVRLPTVRKVINSQRARAGKPPLELPERQGSSPPRSAT